ncbi:MAG TPA: DUF4157 domain-containing protein [Kofleriaceae bacterium]
MRVFAKIAAHDAKAERQAGDVARRSLHKPAPEPPALTARDGGGRRTLTSTGRAHFESMTGGSLDGARMHVDADAERISTLARAEALTYGRDVFIPPANFAPATERGRALIAHELAHVTQAPAMPGTLFRKGTEHYPTVAEQKEIEGILGRHTAEPVIEKPAKAADADKATGDKASADKASEDKPVEKIVDTRTVLSDDEVEKRADELLKPYRETLDTKFPTSGDPKQTVDSLAQATEYSQKALKAIEAKFGTYIKQRFTLTTDPKLTPDERKQANQVGVELSFGDSDIRSFALTILTNHCPTCKAKLSGLEQGSQGKVIQRLLAKVSGDAKLAEHVKRAAKKYVGGAYSPPNRKFHLTPFTADPYGTAVHELMHATTHPAFIAAFIDPGERNILEGFTEYFTRQVLTSDEQKGRGSYQDSVELIGKVRGTMSGPFATSSLDSAEESLRQAYFRGRLDLIGWRPDSEAEAKDVADAGGATAWNPKTAKTEDDARTKRGRAKQDAHSNLLGVGLYFHKDAASSYAIRYARVLSRTEPFARRQWFLEGQLIGTPANNLQRIGGSLGFGVEFQEPWLYLSAGARVIGTGAISGPTDTRVDISPFVGVGTRLWQRVRVGAEGFVLFKVTGDKGVDAGLGGSVLVEF